MTKTDLATAILRKMRVLSRNQAVNPEDKNLVDGHYDRYLRSMQDDGIADWSATDDIPNNVAEFVVVVVAALSSDDFQLPLERTQLLKLEAFGPDAPPTYSALTQIKRLATPKYTYSPTVTTDY